MTAMYSVCGWCGLTQRVSFTDPLWPIETTAQRPEGSEAWSRPLVARALAHLGAGDQGVRARSWPQAASIEVPRLRRTVACTPPARSRSANVAIRSASLGRPG